LFLTENILSLNYQITRPYRACLRIHTEHCNNLPAIGIQTDTNMLNFGSAVIYVNITAPI